MAGIRAHALGSNSEWAQELLEDEDLGFDDFNLLTLDDLDGQPDTALIPGL